MADLHPNIKNMLNRYDFTVQDPYEALREILQEIVLYGLYDAGFFDHAVFYGGTALRILYGLPRFSEDLDFSLLEPDPSFKLSHYEDAVKNRLFEYGFDVDIETKVKESAVQSAFLKGNTVKYLMLINAPHSIVGKYHRDKLIKIKFEVDTQPPPAFKYEEKLHLRPVPFMVKTMVPSSLFAGKMHAVLCRGWENRPKGRDWYDLVWYIARGIPLDTDHLVQRLQQSCKVLERRNVEIPKTIDKDLIMRLLKERIDSLDIDAAKKDVSRFIADARELHVWSRSFFHAISERIELQ
ncbi:nucleotidyl transferase AbiEii/AbiGii toxin family protein [Hydrogenimonas sp.]